MEREIRGVKIGNLGVGSKLVRLERKDIVYLFRIYCSNWIVIVWLES